MGKFKSPLAGVPKPKELWSWISFDVANQSFTLIVNTLLFSVYFSEVVVKDDRVDDRWWAVAFGGSMLLTALVSPWAGAVADARAWKKRFLIASGVLCGVATCGLGAVGEGQLWLALALYIPANFAFAIGENFLASFLPSLAKEDQIGRVSGFSWACSYGAALFLLVVTAVWMKFGGVASKEEWGIFFVFAGLWFLAFLVPTMKYLKEPDAPQGGDGLGVFQEGFRRLASSMRRAKNYPDLTLVLLASLFYGAGMNVVVSFASKLATEYGFHQEQLVIFVAVITVSGIVGTLIPAFVQDRIGHRTSVLFFLVIWIFTAVGFAGFASWADGLSGEVPKWPLWLIGNLLGFGLGSLGSANRAFVGYLAPPQKTAEVYGVWGMVWKLSALLTLPFAWLKDTLSNASALALLAGMLVVGLLLTLRIDEKRGHALAQQPRE